MFTSKWTTARHHGMRDPSLNTHLNARSLWKKNGPHWRHLVDTLPIVLNFQGFGFWIVCCLLLAAAAKILHCSTLALKWVVKPPLEETQPGNHHHYPDPYPLTPEP